MSKPNKANKSNYIQAGRLTPDDFARERQKQRIVGGAGQAVPKRTTRKRTTPAAGTSRKAADR